MTIDPHDESPDSRDLRQGMEPATDAHDARLDVVLRRADGGAPRADLAAMQARIMSQAAFPLAARRRSARTSTADMLAAWVRVALPLAAAAAIFAALVLRSAEPGTLADAELRDSDPAALLSALESDGSSGLAHHLIANDAVASSAAESESQ